MDAAKWQNIKQLMSAAIELSAEKRRDFLAQESDIEIRTAVEKLIAAHERAEDFIEKPIAVERGFAEDDTEDVFIGKQIEDYLILERIGAGGMGAVYLAERLHSDFKQKVALKIIKRGMDSEAILKRFARERRILSTLKHPNIAQLLDGGISKEGLPFFVMEYIEGFPLKQFCSIKDVSLEQRLEIFRQICAAVDEAHKNLIIHRDLKPSNIFVTADGTPKLLDFGIAKLLSDEDDEATATQAKMLTPEYASPEQITGKNITTSSDIYSLGVILYELLSGHRPFETKGKSFDEIIKSVCETEPKLPSSVVIRPSFAGENATLQNKGQLTKEEGQRTKNEGQRTNPKLLVGDLDNIILKALRKEPSERYDSARQFSDDILRFLNGLPVLARQQTLKYRFGKYVRRHRIGVFAAALVLLSLVGGISVATWQAIVARRERARAEQRFNDVRQLANAVIFDYHDSVEKLPGSTDLRQRMVKDAAEYLDKLAVESSDDIALQTELAAAYDRLGDIEGNFFGASFGNAEKA
ncbi:MAG TPA: serine/threonine-protein kinase, partial [Pyrinomonadaceae bacterium]|nr:serine/threonine-protein kinase [Pyrinomonadaceae bacterium]